MLMLLILNVWQVPDQVLVPIVQGHLLDHRQRLNGLGLSSIRSKWPLEAKMAWTSSNSLYLLQLLDLYVQVWLVGRMIEVRHLRVGSLRHQIVWLSRREGSLLAQYLRIGVVGIAIDIRFCRVLSDHLLGTNGSIGPYV